MWYWNIHHRTAVWKGSPSDTRCQPEYLEKNLLSKNGAFACLKLEINKRKAFSSCYFTLAKFMEDRPKETGPPALSYLNKDRTALDSWQSKSQVPRARSKEPGAVAQSYSLNYKSFIILLSQEKLTGSLDGLLLLSCRVCAALFTQDGISVIKLRKDCLLLRISLWFLGSTWFSSLSE